LTRLCISWESLHKPSVFEDRAIADLPSVKLSVALGALPILALELDRESIRLGRSRDNDIVLSLPEVADHHAVFDVTPRSVVLRALEGESFLLNGKPATSAPLRKTDEVILGGYRLQLLAHDGQLGAPGPEPGDSAAETHHTVPVEQDAEAAGGPVTRVLVTAGRDQGLSIPFDRPALLVGRAPDCDFVLHDDTISWRHCSLERVPEGVRVRDLGSRNGTWLDNQRVESAVTAGGRVRLGRTLLTLSSDEGSGLGVRAAPDQSRLVMAEMVGLSPPMMHVYERLREAAWDRLPVLLLGETGTGKELAARAIHSAGPRAGGPFIPLNCAAVPRDLIESELFGHARGAFTGAASERAGAFAAADGGTIFLDEIAELPSELQPKLLRVLEDGVVPRVGGGGRRSDFRVVAATNRDLGAERAARRFRDDLYFRLAVRQIRMPALSDRLEDLPDLVHGFLRTASEITGIPHVGQTKFDESAFAPLREHTWPGNVRELRNLVLAAVARRPGGVVDHAIVEELLADSARGDPQPREGQRTLEEIEQQAVRNALRDSGGNRREAARRLGIAESTLYEKLRKYGFTGPKGRGG